MLGHHNITVILSFALQRIHFTMSQYLINARKHNLHHCIFINNLFVYTPFIHPETKLTLHYNISIYEKI